MTDVIIEDTFAISAPLEVVAAYLQDIHRVKTCVPGLEAVEEIEPNQYEASLVVKVGPIQGSFRGTLDLDTRKVPSRFTARGKGRDQTTGSMVDVSFTADLEEVDGSTEVHAVADLTIRGRLGQFGSGVIQSTAHQLLREFAACASTSIGDGTSSSSPPPRAGLARVMARALVLHLRDLVRSAKRWLKGSTSRS